MAAKVAPEACSLRESVRSWLKWEPEDNIIRWAWTRQRIYEERYRAAMADPRFAHLHFVELRSRAEADALLASLAGLPAAPA